MIKLHELANILGGGKERRRSSDNYMTCCPAHDDKNPSLSIRCVSEGNKEKFIFHCFAGCQWKDIVHQIKLRHNIDFFDNEKVNYKKINKAPVKQNNVITKNIEKKKKAERTYLLNADMSPPSDKNLVHIKKHKNKLIKYRLIHLWPWHGSNSSILFYTARYHDDDGNKIILPITPWFNHEKNSKEWLKLAPPPLEPMFDLHLDDGTSPILIVEGEKTVDAAKRLINRPSAIFKNRKPWITTTRGGSSNVHNTDLSPCKNRDIYIFIDMDGPGLKYAANFFHIEAKSITLIKYSNDKKSGYDLADFELENGTIELLEKYAEKKVILFHLKGIL